MLEMFAYLPNSTPEIIMFCVEAIASLLWLLTSCSTVSRQRLVIENAFEKEEP